MNYHDYKTCIEACAQCAEVCSYCASMDLKEDDVNEFAGCIQRNLECAAICHAAVQMMSLSALGLVALVISTHPGFLRLKVNLEEHPDAPVGGD